MPHLGVGDAEVTRADVVANCSAGAARSKGVTTLSSAPSDRAPRIPRERPGRRDVEHGDAMLSEEMSDAASAERGMGEAEKGEG